MKNKLNKLDLKPPKTSKRLLEKGQSMVEMALFLPILLLLLLGVFEVGWALRSYLVLVNVNRESTRFAARGIYLDFDNTVASAGSTCFDDSQHDPSGIGYCKVISQTIAGLSNQLAMNFLGAPADANSSVIMTYYEVEPSASFNCLGDTDCRPFDCASFVPGHANYVAGDDLNDIQYPLLSFPGSHPLNGAAIPAAEAGHYNQVVALANTTPISAYHYHRGGPFFSRIDPNEKVPEIRGNINRLNCQLAQKGLPPVGDNEIIIEAIFNQEPLVGGPFVAAITGDTAFPLYTHTAMRVTSDLRAASAAGVSCQLAPFMIAFSALPGVGIRGGGGTLSTITFDSSGAANSFDIVSWDAGDHTQATLEANLLDLSRADTEYTDPDDADDHMLNRDDYVQTSGAAFDSNLDDELNALVNQGRVLFPVWDDSNADNKGGTGGNDTTYKLATFVIGSLQSFQTEETTKELEIQLSGYGNNACSCDNRDPDQVEAGCDPL
ncbi:MAG: hypothetical protein GY796_33795 [Chloroflexi bacterium]|nr:hypothetical protein [Chloroflexota bacterium]